MRILLVGVDRSETSRRAVEFARDRAAEVGAELRLVHVIPWSPFSFTTATDNEERPVRRKAELAAATEQVLEPLCEVVGDVPVQVEALHGHPAETLVALAKKHQVTHIVVGRTGESRLRASLFGSTPSQLIQISDLPVTVVP